MEDQIQLVSMDLIDRPVKMAREAIDPEGVRELAESIRESGLLQPVVLRPVNGRFEMVAGDRRYLAHRLLGLKEIKAIVKELDDRETIIVRGIENLQRENLTASEEAGVYMALKEYGGLGVMEIAQKTGKSPQTIKRYMDFWKYPVEVRRSVDNREVSLRVLETLGEIDDPEAFKYFFGMAVVSGVSVKTARLWVDDYFKTKAGEFYASGGGVSPGAGEIESKPVYITCEVCHGATEIKVARNVVLCPECRKKIGRG